MSAVIEQEFTAGNPGADLGGNHGWYIDFATMQQQNTASTGALRDVRRVVGGAAAVAAAAAVAVGGAIAGGMAALKAGFGGGGGGGGGGGAACAVPETPAVVDLGGGGPLPYGGDLQAAMRAGDREAIRVLMAARDADAAAAGGGGGGAAVPGADGWDAVDDDGSDDGDDPTTAAGGGGVMLPPGEFDGCFTTAPLTDDELKEDCAVCYCTVSDPADPAAPAAEDLPTKLNKCGHCFHRGCINQSLAMCNKKCPVCSTIYGIITGTQPEGTMEVSTNGRKLPGFEDAEGTIVISYGIPPGTQGPDHPNPGQFFEGARRTCYIPDSAEGRDLLGKLRTAFERKLIFTVGQSTTSGRDNIVIW